MNHVGAIGLLTLFAVAAAAQADAHGPAGPPRAHVSDAEVAAVTRNTLLIDTHNDIPSRTVDGLDIGLPGHWNGTNNPGVGTMTDIPRLRAGGVGAVFFAAYVASRYVPGNHSAHRALEMIDTIRHDIVAAHPHDFVLATSAGQIEAAHREGKMAALIGIEGGHAIEDSLRLLRDYYALGVRYMTLTHTNTNDWADSQGDSNDPNVVHHGGLTPFGKQVVLEMNRLGMMVDISHVADDTFWAALATSQAPLIASHSSCRALTNNTRNLTDPMIAALAKQGGVIQINFYCDFVQQKASPPTLSDVVDHIDHAVKIGGMDHVGIGSDFDGIECAPVGLQSVADFPHLTRALLQRGYSHAQIAQLYGGNTLRVMREVEAVSRRLRAQAAAARIGSGS
ncbi:MAG TPA: dipeptidase [Terriglobales bacterium]|nr:dipeptidase [Terriglobales bacterium]